jgi:hypothetical protein
MGLQVFFAIDKDARPQSIGGPTNQDLQPTIDRTLRRIDFDLRPSAGESSTPNRGNIRDSWHFWACLP